MRGKLINIGLVALLSACASPKIEETLEERAAWEYYGGKVNYDKGTIEGGYLNDMHEVANLSLALVKSAELFKYDGSRDYLVSLVYFGIQADFAAKNIRFVYEEREKAKEKFPDSWDDRIDMSFQLVLNKFLEVYNTLNSVWEKVNEEINFRELESEKYETYMSAKSYFSNARLTMRIYRNLATQVKVPPLGERASLHQRER